MPVALDVSALQVVSLDKDFQEVSWQVTSSHMDVLDYTFQVFRSESPEGPFEEMTVPFEDRYLFIDRVQQVGHRWRVLYYRLRVTNKRTEEFVDVGPAALEPPADLVAQEIRRAAQLLFHEHAGRLCWILPIRTFGQRCSCYSSTLKTKTRSNCITCYGTSFVRGFLTPIQMAVQIDPNPKSEQNTNTGSTQQSNTTARLGFYPAMKPGDLIIEKENRRWKVVSLTQTEKSRARIHQELQIHEVVGTDIEFRIPLVLEGALRDFWASPPRNFSNPQNIETYEKNFPDIFELYRMR